MKLNLQKIVQSLMEIGMTQYEIAEAIEVTQPTISHLYGGVWGNRQPAWKTAQRLIELAEKKGIRMDGSKDAKVHPRSRWKPKPPVPSKNRVLSK